MKTQQLQPARMPVQHPRGRRWWMIGLGIAVVAVSLVAARYATAPAATSQPVAAPAAAVDPAAQSVLEYLRAHRAMQPLAQDAATRGVLGYLNAHRALEARAFDPAQQSVIGYLNAHRVVPGQRVPDTATQGVLGYLNAHNVALSSQPLAQDAATRGTLGYLNAHRAAEGAALDPAQQAVIDYIRLHSR
jgi:hypothetical protein